MSARSSFNCLLAILLGCFVSAAMLPCSAAESAAKNSPGKAASTVPQLPLELFDGESLEGWKEAPFAGAGEVRIEKGAIMMEMGASLTGVVYTNPVPRLDYEVNLEAMKTSGSDFFCGLTVPVGESHCTLILGGWGGGLVGISSIDHMDASENETTEFKSFEKDRWYRIRFRVTGARLQAWIDDESIVDVNITGRRIALRPGEIEEAVPFSICSYQTSSAVRNIVLKPVQKKIVFLPGKKSHGPGEHDYEPALRLLQNALERSPQGPQLRMELHPGGWPADAATLADADTIVLYSDGSDHDEAAHPLLRDQRLQQLGKMLNRGTGLVALHYTLFVPTNKGGRQFTDWLGGFFDYQNGPATNGWYSKIGHKEFSVQLVDEKHPVLRGVKPLSMREEFYYQMRMPEKDKGRSPLLTIDKNLLDPAGWVAWAVERDDGGRAVAFTGGHYLKNFEVPAIQTFLLNAILWTANAEIPEEGVRTSAKPSASSP